jgi:hypothetical protein
MRPERFACSCARCTTITIQVFFENAGASHLVAEQLDFGTERFELGEKAGWHACGIARPVGVDDELLADERFDG